MVVGQPACKKNFCFKTFLVMELTCKWARYSRVPSGWQRVHSFSLTCEFAQDKNDWRLRIKGTTAYSNLSGKWSLNGVCVGVAHFSTVSSRWGWSAKINFWEFLWQYISKPIWSSYCLTHDLMHWKIHRKYKLKYELIKKHALYILAKVCQILKMSMIYTQLSLINAAVQHH